MPVTPAHLIVPQPVSYLWPERLPAGKPVLLDGDPDLGKSLIALDLCARLSTGRPFPDGRPGPGPANALVLSAEDNAADTIVPRLARLGADLQRVFVWQREGDEPWPWRFPADADRLAATPCARPMRAWPSSTRSWLSWGRRCSLPATRACGGRWGR